MLKTAGVEERWEVISWNNRGLGGGTRWERWPA
jgi:hypothetical protein